MLHLGSAAPSASPKVSRADSGCPKSTLHTTRSTVAILSYKQSLSHYSVVVLPCKTAFIVLDVKPLLTQSFMVHCVPGSTALCTELKAVQLALVSREIASLEGLVQDSSLSLPTE